MKYNNDFKHDLSVGQVGEKHLGDLLTGKTIEVKMDFGAFKTGNVYIEYSSRGKLSGLATSTASFWAIYIMSESGERLQDNPMLKMNPHDIENIIMVSTDKLKNIVKQKAFRKKVKGGDNNTSLGCLIKVKDLV